MLLNFVAEAFVLEVECVKSNSNLKPSLVYDSLTVAW